MSRKYRRGKTQGLPFINNVRPAMERSDPPWGTALIMTAGVLMTLAALLIFVLQR